MTQKNRAQPPQQPPQFRVVYVAHPQAIVQLKHEQQQANASGFELCCYTDVAVAAQDIKRLGAHLVLLDERSSDIRFEGFAQQFDFAKTDPQQYFSLRRVVVVIPAGEVGEERRTALSPKLLGEIQVNPLGLYPYIQKTIKNVLAYKKENSKITACISGGALDGYAYNIGVARALQECCEGGWSLDQCDILSGVSSGAIVAGFLALGITPQDLEESAHRRHKSLKHFTKRGVFDVLPGSLLKQTKDLYKKVHHSVTNTITDLKHYIPLGIFHGDEMEKLIQNQVKNFSSGETFSHLKKELYVGATDQDTGKFVTFGHGEYQDVPIADAIRASMALPPFYPPKEIDGRWYTDGQFSGDADFTIPIHRGSHLMICVTPQVPYCTETPGAVAKRGGYFAVLQSLKTLVQSRFDLAVKHTMNEYPHVDFIFFAPKKDLMDKMSWNPMSYGLRTELISAAMFATMEDIVQNYESISYKLNSHGVFLKPKNVLQKSIHM